MKRLNFLFASVLLSAVLFMTSCDKNESEQEPIKDPAQFYSLGILTTNEISYALSTDDLEEGSISPIGNGVEIPANEFIQSGDYFYFFSRPDQKFYQYEMYADGTVSEKASLLVTEYISGRAYSRNLVDGENTILVMDPIEWGEPAIKWLTISLPDFVISGSGTFNMPDIEKAPGENWKSNVGYATVHDDKVIMPTVYYDYEGNYAEGTYAVALDYPSMENPTLAASNKSTGENGYYSKLIAPTESGDLYIAYYRGFYGTPSDDGVNGYILRINSGESDFDSDYFFDLSENLGEPTQIMQLIALEGELAMGMLFDPNSIGTWDNLENDHYYYAKIDLPNQVISKFNIPKADVRLSRRPLVDDGKYIAYYKSVAENTTNVLEIDYNGSADSFSIGKKIEGDGVLGYSVVKHPSE